MKKVLHFIFAGIFLGVLLTGCAGVTSERAELGKNDPVTQIFAFGDSYSDDGASFSLTKKMVDEKEKDAIILPGELYWENRWTNGPTAVEVLAERLRAGLTNYAVGGAKSGKGNYYHWMDPYEDTGVFGQIEKFRAGLKEEFADPSAVYFIFISANDYFEHADYSLPGTVSDLADRAVANIGTAVSRLAGLGAVRFMIVNSSDLTILPAVSANGQTNPAKDFQIRFNSGLLSETDNLRRRLNIDIVLFDHIAVSNEIRSRPARYGIRNLTAPCQPVYPEVKPVCQSPDEYYFWDEWHPTRRVHQIVGEAMATALKK